MKDEAEILGGALPKRWGRWQRSKNTLVYVVVVGLTRLLRAVPLRVLAPVGEGLGTLATYVARSDRRRALEHLRLAMPELSETARRRIVRRMFAHLGRSAMEMIHLDRVLRDGSVPALSEPQRRLVQDALAEGKGVVAVGGHIGNWELVGQVIAREGFAISGIAKPLYDPRLTRFAHRLRASQGMQVLWRGERRLSRRMLEVFQKGEILALLIDQDTRVQGCFVPFFGRLAFTPTAAASLALRTGAPILVGWIQRRAGRHIMHLERLEPVRTDEREADVVATTAKITARLEAAIRDEPAQWVWLHQRWRTRPQSG